MASKPVALLLADLGVTKSHSGPHVSNANPYSESQFKALKYCPDLAERFGSLKDARYFRLSKGRSVPLSGPLQRGKPRLVTDGSSRGVEAPRPAACGLD